jgi:hypothetical protein
MEASDSAKDIENANLLLYIFSIVLSVPSILFFIFSLAFFLEALRYNNLYSIQLYFWMMVPAIAFAIGYVINKWMKNEDRLMKIFIVIVLLQLFGNLNILVSITGSGDGFIVCSSSDPQYINVKASQIAEYANPNEADIGTVIAYNFTDVDFKDVVCSGSGAFNPTITPSNGCSTSLAAGDEAVLKVNAAAETDLYDDGTIKISYIHPTEGQKIATITCRGPILIEDE